MPDVAQARYRRLLVGGLLAATLVACGRAQPVQVAAGGLPPGLPPAPVATTSFQGAVASVDAGTGTVVVAVTIVWTPVLKAEAHERRVLIDSQTRWGPSGPRSGAQDPAPAELRIGQEIQVEAVDAVEGVWPALKIQLLDID
ncbi:MAG: hypothetical protein ACR2HM_02095 [Acidimicrobiales bacterium]